MSARLRQKQNSIVIDERYISAPVLLKLPSFSGSEEPDNCCRYFSSIILSVYKTYLKKTQKKNRIYLATAPQSRKDYNISKNGIDKPFFHYQ